MHKVSKQFTKVNIQRIKAADAIRLFDINEHDKRRKKDSDSPALSK